MSLYRCLRTSPNRCTRSTPKENAQPITITGKSAMRRLGGFRRCLRPRAPRVTRGFLAGFRFQLSVWREKRRERLEKIKGGKREKKTNTGVGLAEVTGTRAKSFLRPTVVYITGG